MEKYLKALEVFQSKYGSESIIVACDALLEVALQDHFAGTLSDRDYAKLCVETAKVQYPDEQ